MALDEMRRDFPVERWDAGSAHRGKSIVIGAHSDVGGGYPSTECGLSDIALNWMMLKLAGVGVLFVTPPLRVLDLTRFGQDFHAPWTKPPFNLGARARTPKAGHLGRLPCSY